MLRVSNEISLKEFKETYWEYYRFKKEPEAFEVLYNFLNTYSLEQDKTYTHEQIARIVDGFVVMEIVRLWVELTGENFYKDIDTNLILEIIDLLDETNDVYVDHIQKGVRKDLLILFIGAGLL